MARNNEAQNLQGKILAAILVGVVFVIAIVIFQGLADIGATETNPSSSENFISTSTYHSLSPVDDGIESATLQVYNDTWYVQDGAGDYIDFTELGLNPLTSNYSVSLWIYPKANNTADTEILQSGRTGLGIIGITHRNQGTILAGVYDGSAYRGKASSSSVNISRDNWHNIVYVYNSNSTGYLYLDGILQTGNTQPVITSTATGSFLGAKGDHTLSFNGSMENFRFYKRALNATEVLQLNASRQAEKVNTTSLGFQILQDSPLSNRNQASAECLNNVYYRAGGILSANGSDHRTEFYSYNISSGEFRNLSNLPYASQSAELRAVNGKLYYIGGYRSDLPLLYNQTWEYTPSTDTWAEKATFYNAREDFASGVVGDSIYIFGGRAEPQSPSTSTNSSLKYNVTTNTWSTIADLPEPKWSGAFGEAIGNKIYLISSSINLTGYPNEMNMRNTSYVYNTTDNTYTRLADIPVPVAYKDVDAIGELLIIIGGVIGPTSSNQTSLIQIYNTTSNTWSQYYSNFTYVSGYMSSAKCEDGNIYLTGHSGQYFTRFGYLNDKIYEFKFNENVGNLVYESTGTFTTGSINGSTWANDSILVSLVEGVDYTLNDQTGLITFVSSALYSYIMASWDYFSNSYSAGSEAASSLIVVFGDSTTWISIFIIVSFATVILSMFNRVKPEQEVAYY